MRFLKLTEVNSNNDTRAVHINFEYVQSFSIGTKGKDTYVKMHDGGFYFIRESVDLIATLLSNMELDKKELKQPIMMTAEEYSRWTRA